MKTKLLFQRAHLFTSFYFFLLLFFLSISSAAQRQTWKTDQSIKNASLNEFKTLLMRDGIPPIYSPRFWAVKQAKSNFFKHEPVISVEINGEARAYPLSILMYHEIVNDVIDNVPIIATYCPLCNAAVVFDRRLSHNNQNYTLKFGVSGMLRKSDMIMWDHQTESWWQQITGEALVGKLTGAELTIIPSQLISFEDFYKNYPNGKVLSTNTGHLRRYGTNPYQGYDNLDSQKPRLFSGKVDKRLPAMERVITISRAGRDYVYPLSTIEKKEIIHDNISGKEIVIFFQKGLVSTVDKKEIELSRSVGAATVFVPYVDSEKLSFQKHKRGFMDIESQSIWTITGTCIEGKYKGRKLEPVIYGNHFAFAWLSFRPESVIYK